MPGIRFLLNSLQVQWDWVADWTNAANVVETNAAAISQISTGIYGFGEVEDSSDEVFGEISKEFPFVLGSLWIVEFDYSVLVDSDLNASGGEDGFGYGDVQVSLQNTDANSEGSSTITFEELSSDGNATTRTLFVLGENQGSYPSNTAGIRIQQISSTQLTISYYSNAASNPFNSADLISSTTITPTTMPTDLQYFQVLVDASVDQSQGTPTVYGYAETETTILRATNNAISPT